MSFSSFLYSIWHEFIVISESVLCYNYSCQTRHKTRNLKLMGKTFQLVPKIKPQSRFTARKITKKSMCYYVLVITMVRSSHFFFKTNSLFVSKDCFTRPWAVQLFNWKIKKNYLCTNFQNFLLCNKSVVHEYICPIKLYCIYLDTLYICTFQTFKTCFQTFKNSYLLKC